MLLFYILGRSLASVQPSKFADQKLKDLVNYLMKTTAYLDGSHRITSSLQWLANIESIMISHLSNAKALFVSWYFSLYFEKLVRNFFDGWPYVNFFICTGPSNFSRLTCGLSRTWKYS